MKLTFNQTRDRIEEKLQKVDLVCADLDECLFPFFTQVIVAGEILFESLFKRHQRKYLPQLCFGALTIGGFIILTFGNIKRLRNEFLMKHFERTMRGIPLDLIRKHSQYIHTFFYSESLQFLKWFAERGAHISILSLSIQPILDILMEKLSFINDGIGNNIVFDKVKGTFRAYNKPIMVSGEDKLLCFKDLINKYNAKCPLVVGHSLDEMPLVEYASSMNGISVGINPKKKLKDKFDIVLNSVSWEPLVSLVKSL